jgi:C-terminal processing protease CtpA/Prc
MQKVSGVIVLSLAAAVGATALVLNNSGPDSSATDTAVTSSQFDSSAATEQRILALEMAVSEERQARQLLEDELLILFAELEQLEADREGRLSADEEAREARGNVDSESVTRRQQVREERVTTGRRDAMIKAGMPPDRADYILRRESEMRYEQMQAVYQARNSGESLDPMYRNFNADSMLREEIGDAEYEMYLEANNRSTSVGVSSVMASSPGERAGLQAGDEIVGYDGQRVFGSSELIQRTMAGGDGNVVVDVMRDGSLMQVVVPRGPIGVEIGRFRGR